MTIEYNLESIVPWGRTLAEYRAMFLLSDDGSASFNLEAILEMLRVADDVRIFHLMTLKNEITTLKASDVLKHKIGWCLLRAFFYQDCYKLMAFPQGSVINGFLVLSTKKIFIVYMD